MKYELHKRPDGLQIDLHERLGFTEHAEFRRLVSEVVETKPARVVVDLAGVTAIDSAGLGLLVILNERVKQFGGTVKVARPTQQVAELLTLVEFDKILSIDHAA